MLVQTPVTSSNARRTWLVLGGLAVVAVVALIATTLRRDAKQPTTSTDEATQSAENSASNATPAAAERSASVPSASAPRIATSAAAGNVLATLGWGSGPGRIGRPEEEEGHGETPLRLTTDSAGNVLLLDPVNDRLVRLGPDGKPLPDVRLPIKEPRDVGVAKDGTVLLLDADAQRGGSVVLLGPDGQQKSLPLPPGSARSARALVTSGNDVYLEAYNGELTRLGTAQGVADPNPTMAPGRPTRDGRGYLSALIADPESGRVHVYVVENPSQQQRFSRLLHTTMFVEGIFLVDTSLAGTIYLGITGNVPGGAPDVTSAQLLCLEPEKGEILGGVDLPVNVGEEAILDAKALDGGGVVFSVHSRQGMRIERHDCR